jgi:hypothetical protein
MRHFRATILVCIIILSLTGLSYAKESGDGSSGISSEKAQAQWKVIIPKMKAGDKFRMAAFNDEKFGITGGAGDPGKAHITTDGGKTWNVASTSGG